MEFSLIRTSKGDEGVTGFLQGGGLNLSTIECPDLGNQHNISCISVGRYPLVYRFSPKQNCKRWHIEGAIRADGKPAEDTMFHGANFAGNVAKGFKAELEGCIAPGLTIGKALPVGFKKKQLCVLDSRVALAKLEAVLAKEKGPHFLTIGWL